VLADFHIERSQEVDPNLAAKDPSAVVKKLPSTTCNIQDAPVDGALVKGLQAIDRFPPRKVFKGLEVEFAEIETRKETRGSKIIGNFVATDVSEIHPL